MHKRKSPPSSRNVRRPSAQAPLRRAKRAGEEPDRYSATALRRLAAVQSTLTNLLVRAGLLIPKRLGRTVHYSFQDLTVLRLAGVLQTAKIPSDKIVEALTRIREVLPPASDLAIPTEKPQQTVVTVERPPLWVDARAPGAMTLKRREAAARRRREAAQYFEHALALEDSDINAARAAYLAALETHSEHLEARINLGRLLHINGELELAEKIYREAKHASALLSFNLAILLEDLNRAEEAVVAYRDALALDPSLHDAHFNLSRLHERAERPQEALRHLLAYRRQTR